MNQRALRKPTNLSIDAELLHEARQLNINLSQAAEAGLRHAVAEARARYWRAENADAIVSSNTWLETHGLPLDRYRRF